MIKGVHHIRSAAKVITKLSQGDCELCGDPIGDRYCAPAQLIPRMDGKLPTLEIRYQVCCMGCFKHIDKAINERRALKP
jgi:hypothetical protein